MRWADGAAMATTFLPLSGKFAAWSHPAEKPLATHVLGRTGREVTTFGLAGGNRVQWELSDDTRPSRSSPRLCVRASPTSRQPTTSS